MTYSRRKLTLLFVKNHRDRTGKEPGEVTVLTGIHRVAARPTASANESPEAASIRTRLGYKGVVPYSEGPRWFLYRGGFFRTFKKHILVQPETGTPLSLDSKQYKSEIVVR